MSRHEYEGVMTHITEIYIESGVNKEAKPFCPVSVALSDGKQFHAQLSPSEVRMLALAWLTAAEASEQDALVLEECRAIGLDDTAIGGFVNAIRDRRSKLLKEE